jgi:hypothetical protein
MTILEITACFASIVSLCFAAYVYYKNRLNRAKEEAKALLYRERIRHIHSNLRASATSLQLIIRRADDPQCPVIELQNLARSLRIAIFSSLLIAVDFDRDLKEWRFGHLLNTEGRSLEKPEELDIADDVTNESDSPDLSGEESPNA